MREPHFYKNLDTDDKLTLDIDMRQLAERIVDMNYGVHRLLSHLIDVRRERLSGWVTKYELDGQHDVAEYCRREGDRLADGIESLLQQGLH